MNKHTKRRKRRRANAVARNGKKAVRRHTRPGGRTGSIHSKRPLGREANELQDDAPKSARASRPQLGL